MSSFRSLALLVLGLLGAQVMAFAQAPANDNWSSRTAISTLPFSTSESNMYLATTEGTDPAAPCVAFLTSESHTLWYSYTTGSSTEYLTLALTASPAPVAGIISVYTGSPGSFHIVSGACGAYRDPSDNARISGLRLAPNTTYSIEVGSTAAISSGNVLNFSVTAAVRYLVNTTADTNDGGCGATCSLRDAISASNANPGAVIIPAGTYTLSIAGGDEDNNASGDLDALSGMGIYGAGMTQTIIDANHIDRVLQLDSHGYGSMGFVIGDLTLRNGNAVTTGPIGNEYYGGGLLLSNTSEPDFIGIERVAVLSNFAKQAGGGIYLSSPGTIRDSLIDSNSVDMYGGGGIELEYDTGYPLAISGSTISNNSAPNGGNGQGGGIYAQGLLYLSNSTISKNSAGNAGGGIYSQSNGALNIASSTVVYNSAGDNPYATQIGGGVMFNGASFNPPNSVTNSIIAYNTVGNPGDQPDCAIGYDSPVFSSSYNLVRFPNNCPFSGTGDVTGVDPLVSTALAYNGGLTPTYALLTGSPALNSANPAGCSDALGFPLTYDQRGAGFPRVIGSACDKGALESPVVTPPGSPVMNPASDSGSSNSDGITNVQTPGFTGTCTNGTTIQLQVDAVNVAPTAACSSGSYAVTVSSPIADGAHAVTATANNGTVTSLMSAPLAIVIETTPPVPGFVSTPPNPDTNTSPSFAFSSNQAGSTFTCSLDGAAYVACTSPQMPSVGIGPHTFAVMAMDPAGNISTAPATYAWSVLPPTPATPALAAGSDSGLSASDNITNVAAPVFTGNCTDGDSMQLIESAQPLGSPGICSGGTYSIGVALTEGNHSVSVTATSGGYTSAASPSLAVVIDRTAPLAPTITGPGGLAGATTPITGTAAENNGLITVSEGATTVCTVLGPFVSGNWSCTPSFTTSGAHTLTATQTDLAGNVSAASSAFGVSIDVIFRNGFE